MNQPEANALWQQLHNLSDNDARHVLNFVFGACETDEHFLWAIGAALGTVTSAAKKAAIEAKQAAIAA